MANSDKSRALEDPAMLLRIADALERLAPPAIASQLPEGDAFVWEPAQGGLIAVPHVARVDLSLLKLSDLKNQKPGEPAVKKYFMHGVSHPIGLDVHDVTYNHFKIEPGWVMTVEPAIYIKDEGFGVRLENTVLVTESGQLDLMAEIPIEAEEIEDLMHSRK